jgi:FkbM family methyltransferase
MSDGWKPLDEGRWRAELAPGHNAQSLPISSAMPNMLQRILIKLAKTSFLHRGLFRPLVSRAIFAFGANKPVDVVFRNAIFRLTGGLNLIEHGILLHPDYNKTDIDFLSGALFQGAVFIDIGSNIGLYALPLAQVIGPEGKVIAIDANPQMAAVLAQNVQISGLKNVQILSVAVSDSPGRANLAVRKNDDAIVRIDEDDQGEIAVTTLSAIVAEAGLKQIDALKIDIEGHEDKALAPFILAAPEWLLPKRIVIEWTRALGDYPACAAAFANRGYVLKGRTRNNSLYALGR